MLHDQFLEGVPVHPPGLPAAAVENARLPSQLVADAVCSPCHPVVADFPLAGVGQLVTVTTGEDAAAIEDRHTPTAAMGGTEEPGAFTAKVADGPVEIDGIAFVLPIVVAPLSIGENHPVCFSAHVDGAVIDGGVFRAPAIIKQLAPASGIAVAFADAGETVQLAGSITSGGSSPVARIASRKLEKASVIAQPSPVDQPARHGYGEQSPQHQGGDDRFDTGGKAGKITGAFRSLEGRMVAARAALCVSGHGHGPGLPSAHSLAAGLDLLVQPVGDFRFDPPDRHGRQGKQVLGSDPRKYADRWCCGIAPVWQSVRVF